MAEELYSEQLKGYYSSPMALAAGMRRSAIRMPLADAIDLWARIGLACGAKPSAILAAARDCEVSAWGQRLDSANRETVSYFSYRMDGGSFNGHHLVYVVNGLRKVTGA